LISSNSTYWRAGKVLPFTGRLVEAPYASFSSA